MEQKDSITLDKLEYYHVLQPIMDIANNQVFGYEMLLRSTKIKNPETLFHYAKLHNQSFELDIRSIKQAFRTINDSEAWFKNYHIFINVLPSTLAKPNALSLIKKYSASTKFGTNQIVFEITEDKKEQELLACQQTIGSMKNYGFLIAVDDLGKGDSTLSYAIELKPHVVKLDKMFAKDLVNSPRKQKEIEAMVKIFGKSKILILEGIETAADLQTAKDLGIQYVQGFYYGKPEPLGYILNKS